MGKKEHSGFGSINIPDGAIEKVLDTIKEISEKNFDLMRENAEKENEQKEADREEYRHEKDLVRKEFERVAAKMAKTDPVDETYRSLARSLDALQSILNFWH